MPETRPVIRLLGGPPGLADRTVELVEPHDRADADPQRFVRATRDSLLLSFSHLQTRCRDRGSAEQLAARWRLVEYRAVGRRRDGLARRYRFTAVHPLVAARDETGRWSLTARTPDAGPPLVAAPEPALPTEPVWGALEARLDEAAGRFATVTSLLPDGPLADRALEARLEVGTCVADAARLCAVGAALRTDAPELGALASRVAALVDAIEAATSHVVALHLDTHHARDPRPGLAALGQAWSEVAP